MDESAILRNLFCSLFQGNIGEGTKSRRFTLPVKSVVVTSELAPCRHDQQVKAPPRGEFIGLVSRLGIFRCLVRENLVRHTFHPLCRYPARRYFFAPSDTVQSTDFDVGMSIGFIRLRETNNFRKSKAPQGF